MRAGLLASTVTPGRMAPDVSFTTPAKAPCANAVTGAARAHARPRRERRTAQVIAASFDRSAIAGPDSNTGTGDVGLESRTDGDRRQTTSPARRVSSRNGRAERGLFTRTRTARRSVVPRCDADIGAALHALQREDWGVLLPRGHRPWRRAFRQRRRRRSRRGPRPESGLHPSGRARAGTADSPVPQRSAHRGG